MEGEGLVASADVKEKAERAPARKFGKRAVVAADGSGDTTSIQEAIDGVDEHGTVSVKPGTYREHLVVSKLVSIEGAGRDLTRIEATEGRQEGRWVAVTVRNCKNVSFKGLTIASGTSLGEQSGLVLMEVQDADASVEECNLLWAQFGITISGNSNARIDKCLVAAIWGTGIAIGEQASATVTNCEVRNC
jgi:nitrous oxidase accessory protein NosD